MTTSRLAACLWAAALILCTLAPSATAADGCAPDPISARGEPAAFEWLAKTKARANWRSRVRATKWLGEPYSTWSRADNRNERCTTSPRGIVCTFTANPCKR